MAEVEPADETTATKPPPKRRRILDPSAIVPVPIYSNKVSSSLRLKPMIPVFSKDDTMDDMLWSPREKKVDTVTLSESEEEEEEVSCAENRARRGRLEAARCPSPPPPESPVQKQSRQVKKKLNEIDRKLNSVMSPAPQTRALPRLRPRCPPPPPEGEDEDEDVVIITNPTPLTSPPGASTREIPLKIRCRTDIHKIPVQSSTPMSSVLTRLSVILEVPPPRLLLLREDVELQTGATVDELGLGIADILECVVVADGDKRDGGGNDDVITVRLQGKDRDSTQEFSLRKDQPLGSIFSQYLSKMSARAQRKVSFQFDGSKVTSSQTPAQLDMEDGDIIEVWI